MVENTDKNEKSKKDDFTKNFLYVNNHYRSQFNFSSEQHLENMKFFVQEEPTIREDINTIVDEVDKDIKWKCDKKHFTKKYFNLIEKNRKSKIMKELHDKEKTILPDIKNKFDKKKFVERKFKKKLFRQFIIKLIME